MTGEPVISRIERSGMVSIRYSLKASILRIFPIPNVSCEYTNSFRMIVLPAPDTVECSPVSFDCDNAAGATEQLNVRGL